MISDINDLIEKLLEGTKKFEDYENILHNLKLDRKDVEKYLYFKDNFYTRNLVYKNDNLELMLLCWEKGQETPIHNHQGSEGWVYVISGEIEEKTYRVHSDAKRYDVELIKTQKLPPKSVSHINDDIGIHSLSNLGDQSITLHLYVPIIKECMYFDPTTFSLKSRTMSYFSSMGTVL